MKKTELMMKVGRGLSRFGLKAKKHSPEILIVAGVVGTVASAVMACKATTKLSEILEETKEDIDEIHEVTEDPKIKDKYSKEDSEKDLAITYVQTGVKIVKLYAPAVALGALSLGCIITSNNILRKRNVALAAAYTAVDKSFKTYRKRVTDRFGKELDREIRYGIKAKQVEKKVVDENGEEKVVKETIEVVDPNQYSEYARFFDDGCKGWDDDSEFNLTFLRHTQNQMNDLLQSRGYVYLNEVYEALGIPKTKDGALVGWVHDTSNPDLDNFIDFGIYNPYRGKARDFVNGYEKTILLDFNVEGIVYELMK